MTYVGVDFETDDLMSRLVDAGSDSAAPAFFLWLGVVPYLTPDAVAATLRAISSVPGGEVVFDYTNPADQPHDLARGDRTDLVASVAEVGEPLSAGLEPPIRTNSSSRSASARSRTSTARRSGRATSAARRAPPPAARTSCGRASADHVRPGRCVCARPGPPQRQPNRLRAE